MNWIKSALNCQEQHHYKFSCIVSVLNHEQCICLHTHKIYRYVNFLEHLGSSASVQQSDVLWCRHNYSSSTTKHTRFNFTLSIFNFFCWWLQTHKLYYVDECHHKYTVTLCVCECYLIWGCSGWLTAGHLPSQEACRQPGSPTTPSPPTNMHMQTQIHSLRLQFSFIVRPELMIYQTNNC